MPGEQNPSVQEWLAESSTELREQIGVPCTIYAFGLEPQAGQLGHDVQPEQLQLLGRTNDKNGEAEIFYRVVSSVTAGRHMVVISDLQKLANAMQLNAAPLLQELKTILTVPVFNPRVFQPSPVTRPVLGVLAFGCNLMTEDLVRNYKLHLVAQKYAGLVAKSMLDLANRARQDNLIAGS